MVPDIILPYLGFICIDPGALAQFDLPDLLAVFLEQEQEPRHYRNALVFSPRDQQMVPLNASAAATAFAFPAAVAAGSNGLATLEVFSGPMQAATDIVSAVLQKLASTQESF